MNRIPIVKLRKSFRKKDGGEKTVHPWIFSGAVYSADPIPAPGDFVEVRDAENNFIGYGTYSPHSNIRVRIFSFKKDEFPNDEWWIAKLKTACDCRKDFLLKKRIFSNSYRLVFGESDFLPGLVVDRYENYLSAQFLSVGTDKIKNKIAEWLMDISGTSALYESDNYEIRKFEGLSPSSGLMGGKLQDHENVIITENGLNFNVNFKDGQKTGFYLDQRENRKIISDYIQKGMKVLDCFSYTGAFGVYALKAGADSLCLIENSKQFLETAAKNFELNGIQESRISYFCGDAFKILREFRDRNEKFDFIILDPPKFAPTKSSVPKALRAYKDINMLGMKLLQDGGLLATFSCSLAVNREKFTQVISWAAEDSRKSVQILEHFSQPPDHPVALNFPESDYLKGFLCRVFQL